MKWHIVTLCVLLCFAAGCAPNTEETPAMTDLNTTSQATKKPTEPTPDTPPQEEEKTVDPISDATPPEEEKAAEPAQETKSPEEEKTAKPEPVTPPQAEEEPTETEPDTPPQKDIKATITMEDGGIIVLELYPDLAPQSVRNFVYLARKGFYNGLKFHRIMAGFMIQGGDPDGTGGGGPGYTIKGEFKKNGFDNDLKHTRGVVSMARRNEFDSAGSQFFIMHDDAPSLDGSYAAFGRVTSGMDVVDRLAQTPNSGSNGAVAEENKPVIKTITIDSDAELPEPDMLK